MSTEPFGLVADPGEGKKAPNLLQYEFKNTMFEMFGISGNVVASLFLKKSQEVFDGTRESRRCSAARALFEGRIPGVPLPLENIPHLMRVRLEKALKVLDLFETIRMMEAEKSTDPEVRRDLETTKAVMGTN